MYNGSTPLGDEKVSKIDNLPFYYIGFKSSSPELTLRNRIWSLLCAQTLYRTISGVIDYRKAIKLLYHAETQRLSKPLEGTPKSLNMSWNRWCGRSLSSSFLCSDIRSSARRSTRTPNSFSVRTPAPDCIPRGGTVQEGGGRPQAPFLTDQWPLRVRHSDRKKTAKVPDRAPWQPNPWEQEIGQPEPHHRIPSVDRRKPG